MDDLDLLMREVRSYLRAVDAFRAAGHEPTWLGEETVPREQPAAKALPGSAQLLRWLDRG
jgi:hypothetical protein